MPDLETLATVMRTDDLLGWFAETTLVASALAALAALLSKVRRLSPGPAARHALWLMVMIKLVTPPLVHWPWSVASPVVAARPEQRRSQDRPIRAVADIPKVEDSEDLGLDRDRTSVRVAESTARDESKPTPTSKTPALALGGDAIRPWQALKVSVVVAWLCGSIVIGVGLGRRVRRFRRLLDDATPAPGWLVEEAGRIGRRLEVRVPAILVVPGLGTPILWCLGRPVLLVPSKLLQTMEAGRWRSIVAHELAHLRRGDHWVRRLELAAGLAWWWNPLYWLARGRLDFEAELACDAWAVWASPSDRLTYAESLIRICTSLSPTGSPTPALGIAGTGRSFERRLTMILQNRVDRRVSTPGLLAASMLAALALPSWTLAEPPQAEGTPPAVATIKPNLTPPVEVVDDPEDDDDAAEDKASKAEEKAAKPKAERDKMRKELAEKELAEIDKEMEKKFGPGSDFAKKMEALGKEMEAKFGPDSDFVKKMETFGKEMEAKFGPGSDFAKEMEKNFGADSDFAKKVAETAKKVSKAVVSRDETKVESDQAKAESARTKAESDRVKAEIARTKSRADARAKVQVRAKATTPTPDKRARRIEMLESRINEMTAELKKLKAESEPKNEEDDQG